MYFFKIASRLLLFFVIILFIDSCINADEKAFSLLESNDDIIALNPVLETSLKKHETIRWILDSIEYYENNNKHLHVIFMQQKLANELRNTGNYHDAIQIYHYALDSIHPKDPAVSIYNGLANVYYELFLSDKKNTHYLDSAQYYVESALSKPESETNFIEKSNALNIYGAIHIHRSLYNKALTLLEESNQIRKSEGLEPSLAVLANLSYVNIQLDSLAVAEDYSNRCLSAAQNDKNIVFCGICYSNLALIYDAKKDSVTATKFRSRINKLQENNEVLLKYLVNRQLLLNYQDKKTQNKILGLYQERYYLVNMSRLLLISIIVVFFASLLLSYLYINNYRKKKLLAQQELIIAQKEMEANKAEMLYLEEQKKLECERAQNYQLELQVKDQELAYQSLRHVNLARVNQSIQDKLGKYKLRLTRKKDQKDFEKDMEDLSRDTNRDPISDFEDMFIQMHGDFYEKLTEINMDFTRSELQLCALLRMNLPTKEIAGILNLSPQTIDQRRHKIRKKLDLTNGQNLNSYLISL